MVKKTKEALSEYENYINLVNSFLKNEEYEEPNEFKVPRQKGYLVPKSFMIDKRIDALLFNLAIKKRMSISDLMNMIFAKFFEDLKPDECSIVSEETYSALKVIKSRN
jgi:hypothetical protein